MARYLGIIRDGEYLLQSAEIEDGDGRRAMEKRLEAERHLDLARRGWHAIYPDSLLTIEPLSKRDGRGWEVEKPRPRLRVAA